MKKNKLVWRLSNRPTVEEITLLLKENILTKEEAKQILFSSQTEEDRDKKSLESEIKFLREIVEKLSRDKKEIIETIRYIEKPYYKWDWYQPYITWCSTDNGNYTGGTTVNFTEIN